MPDVLSTLQKLPTVAYIDNSHDKSPGASPVIAVKRGVMGYFPVHTRLTAAVLNKNAGVSTVQADAMHIGSSLGHPSGGTRQAQTPITIWLEWRCELRQLPMRG